MVVTLAAMLRACTNALTRSAYPFEQLPGNAHVKGKLRRVRDFALRQSWANTSEGRRLEFGGSVVGVRCARTTVTRAEPAPTRHLSGHPQGVLHGPGGLTESA